LIIKSTKKNYFFSIFAFLTTRPESSVSKNFY
jgi:hypothetical protein